jgi:hypothetical protein
MWNKYIANDMIWSVSAIDGAFSISEVVSIGFGAFMRFEFELGTLI